MAIALRLAATFHAIPAETTTSLGLRATAPVTVAVAGLGLGLMVVGLQAGGLSLALLVAAALAFSPWLPTGLPEPALLVVALALLAIGLWRLREHFRLPTRRTTAIAAASIAALSYLFFVECAEIGRLATRPTDFKQFLLAAEALRDGQDPYAATNVGYFYPPPFASWILPFTWVDPAPASMIWFVTKIALLLVTFRAIVLHVAGVHLRTSTLTAVRLPAFTLLALFATARFWLADLQYGNTNVVVACAMAWCVLADARRQAPLAGFTLAVAGTIKVVPFILGLHLLASRQWRSLMWLGLALVLIVGLPLVLDASGQTQAWSSYLELGARDKLSQDLGQPDNQSLWGALSRLGLGGATHRITWLAMGVLMLSVAGLASWRTARESTGQNAVGDQSRRIVAGAIYPVATLLISPGSWVVHYANTILPTSVLLAHAMARRSRPLTAAFAVATLVFVVSGWWRATVRWSTHYSWFVVAALLVMVALASMVVRKR